MNKCYYVPALSMNIVVGLACCETVIHLNLRTNGCSIYMNDIFYVHAPDRNGLFIVES